MTDRPLALLRCDALPETGVGHLVRCLAVAEAAGAAGWRTALVGDIRSPLARRFVEDARLEVLAGAGTGWEELVTGTGARVVHVDHYSSSAPAPGDPAAGAPVVSAVQDGRHGRRDADVVLDASSTGDVSAAVVQARVRLTGPGEALVRRAVLAAAERRRTTPPRPRVLVTAGGTDAAGILPSLTSIVADAVPTGPAVEQLDVLVLDPGGPPGPLAPGIHRRAPGPDLVDLAAESCLVVTASGTTTSELAVIGVPMAVVQAVPNQRETYERLVGAGAALGLGDAAGLAGDHDRLAARLRTVLGDPARRAELARAAAGQVDGAGAQRLVRAWERVLLGSTGPADEGWSVAAATDSDSDLLLSWRNDPGTRTRSLDQDPVDPGTHARWFARVSGDPDRLLLIVRRQGVPVGTVRLDRLDPGWWEVSITVAPQARGNGLGPTVLRCGEEYLSSRSAAAVGLAARIRADNTASRRLFAGCGYRPGPSPLTQKATPDVLVVTRRLEA